MLFDTFINTMSLKESKKDKVKLVESLYFNNLPDEVTCLVSNLDKTVFFDNDSFIRLLSFQELIDAEADMNVSFCEKGILPFFDLGDNDYLVYDLKRQTWCKYNIVDEVAFSFKTKLSEYQF